MKKDSISHQYGYTGLISDETALVNALKNKQIVGAGLDVYEDEPKLKGQVLRNWIFSGNAPHFGSAGETRTKMSVMAAENIIAVLSRQKPKKFCKSGSTYMIKIRKAKVLIFRLFGVFFTR